MYYSLLSLKMIACFIPVNFGAKYKFKNIGISLFIENAFTCFYSLYRKGT